MISGSGGASSGEVAGSGRMTRLDTTWTSTVAPHLCFVLSSAKLGAYDNMFRQTFTTHL
jgi:hypothetical protein